MALINLSCVLLAFCLVASTLASDVVILTTANFEEEVCVRVSLMAIVFTSGYFLDSR